MCQDVVLSWLLKQNSMKWEVDSTGNAEEHLETIIIVKSAI